MPILGIIASARQKIKTAFRTVSNFTTGSNYPTPYGSQGQYNQSMMAAFPDASVFMSVGGYTPGTTYSSVYSISGPTSGWTGRPGYPHTVFQTTILPLGDKFFVFGGNGLNGTAGGGTTNQIRYMQSNFGGWTNAGTMFASGGTGVSRTRNYFYYRYSGTSYYGNGITGWTATSALPSGVVDVSYIRDGQTWGIPNSANYYYYSNNDGATWTATTLVNPINTTQVGVTMDMASSGTATQNIITYNGYQDGSYGSIAVYSFSGAAFTAIGNSPAQGNSSNSMQGIGIFNNYLYYNYNNGSPYYATFS